MTDNKDFQKLYVDFQLVTKATKQLEQQLEQVDSQLMELLVTRQSLEDIGTAEQDREVVVPINAGIYAKAALKDIKKFVVNVGASVMVEKDMAATTKMIDEQVKEMEEIRGKISLELKAKAEQASALETELSQMAVQMKG